MSTVMREVTWGDALVARVFHQPGGLKVLTDAIRELVGPQVGTRQTFTKFYKIGDPATISDRDRFRVWLLLAALGEEPSDWGIGEREVPAFMDAERLREQLRDEVTTRVETGRGGESELVRHQGLEPRTRWFGGSDTWGLSAA